MFCWWLILLIFDRNIENYLPQSGISFAYFARNDIAEDLIDKKQISGNLLDMADHVLRILKNNIKTPSTCRYITGGKGNMSWRCA